MEFLIITGHEELQLTYNAALTWHIILIFPIVNCVKNYKRYNFISYYYYCYYSCFILHI